jgi:hypothetical protein
VVDVIHLEEREVPLVVPRGPHGALHGVAGAEVEAANLRGGDVDVVRAGEVVVIRRAKEAEAVGEALQHPVGLHLALAGGVGLEEREDELLLAQARGVFDVELARHGDELGHRLLLQFAEVDRFHLSPREVVPTSRRRAEGGATRAVVAAPRAPSVGRNGRAGPPRPRGFAADDAERAVHGEGVIGASVCAADGAHKARVTADREASGGVTVGVVRGGAATVGRPWHACGEAAGGLDGGLPAQDAPCARGETYEAPPRRVKPPPPPTTLTTRRPA